MSSCVFHGSALPVSAKIAVTLGTTDTMRMLMMPAPMTVIDDRDRRAREMILPRSLFCASRKSARRNMTGSRLPDASPARTMLT